MFLLDQGVSMNDDDLNGFLQGQDDDGDGKIKIHDFEDYIFSEIQKRGDYEDEDDPLIDRIMHVLLDHMQ